MIRSRVRAILHTGPFRKYGSDVPSAMKNADDLNAVVADAVEDNVRMNRHRSHACQQLISLPSRIGPGLKGFARRIDFVQLTIGDAVGSLACQVAPDFNEKGRAKIELALARGKKLHDKRETEKKRDWAREKGRLLRMKG